MKNPKQLLIARRYLLDLSVIPLLPELNEKLPQGFLLVSASLDKVLSEEASSGLYRILADATSWGDSSDAPDTIQSIARDSLPRILESYQRLRERGVIEVVSDEHPDTQALRSALVEIVRGGGTTDSVRLADGTRLSSTGLVARHLGTILAYSKRTGTAILARGRMFVERLTRAIATLELPQRADRLVERKSAFTKRLLAKPGFKAGKFFIGTTLAFGGLLNPIVGGAGVLFCFIDP